MPRSQWPRKYSFFYGPAGEIGSNSIELEFDPLSNDPTKATEIDANPEVRLDIASAVDDVKQEQEQEQGISLVLDVSSPPQFHTPELQLASIDMGSNGNSSLGDDEPTQHSYVIPNSEPSSEELKIDLALPVLGSASPIVEKPASAAPSSAQVQQQDVFIGQSHSVAEFPQLPQFTSVATQVAAPFKPGKSPTNRVVWLWLFTLALGVTAVVTFYDDIPDLNIIWHMVLGKTEAPAVVPLPTLASQNKNIKNGPRPIPGKPPFLKSPSVALKNSKIEPAATPADHQPQAVSNAHEKYFEAIDQALSSASAQNAVNAFQQPMVGELQSDIDKVTAAALEARFYLLVGQYEKSKATLEKWCAVPSADSAEGCIHYVRTLLNLRSFAKASDTFKKLRLNVLVNMDADFMKSEADLLALAVSAFQQTNATTVGKLIKNLFLDQELSEEWKQQRSQWILKSLAMLPRKERVKLGEGIFVDRKSNLGSLFSQYPERIMAATSDGVLAAFFRYLAADVEAESTLPKLTPDSRSEGALVAILLSAMADSGTKTPYKLLRELNPLSQHARFKNMYRIVGWNLLMNENEFSTAAQDMKQTTLAKDFEYEQSLAVARLATLNPSNSNVELALANLIRARQNNPNFKNEFSGWFIQARLLRILKQDAQAALTQAQNVAVTQNDFGYVALEQVKGMQSLGKMSEAKRFVRQALNRIPYHGPLLQTAIEIASQAGGDLRTLELAQEKMPERYWRRNVEIQPITDATLMELILSLP